MKDKCSRKKTLKQLTECETPELLTHVSNEG